MVSETSALPPPSLILYGGTFDPPHVGHQRALEAAHDLFPPSQIWLVPSPAPAGAEEQHKRPVASFAQRLAMCQLNFADALHDGWLQISSIEADLPAPNFTIQTLHCCAEQMPAKRLALLIGKDQLAHFRSWRDPHGILKLADLIVINRDGPSSIELILNDLADRLAEPLHCGGADTYLWDNLKTAVYILSEKVSDAASREVRDDLGLAWQRHWLCPEVRDYIEQQKIYQK